MPETPKAVTRDGVGPRLREKMPRRPKNSPEKAFSSGAFFLPEADDDDDDALDEPRISAHSLAERP